MEEEEEMEEGEEDEKGEGEEEGEDEEHEEDEDHRPHQVRLYMGGMPANLTHNLFMTRFKPFHDIKVIDTYIPRVDQADETSMCKGFAYATLEAEAEAIERFKEKYQGGSEV